MRSLLLLSAAAALALAAPDHCPKITSVGFSGSGCPSSVANAVKSLTGDLGDVANFTLSRLKGDSTDNCEIHLQASGGSSGWQVAVQSIAYSGNVQLSAGSQLDTFTQVYWTDHAADTCTMKSSLTCAGPDIRGDVTVRSSTNDPAWSKCTGPEGNPGILNVNFRPVVQGNAGSYDFRQASWALTWRKC